MAWGERKARGAGTEESCKVPTAMTQSGELKNSVGGPIPIPLELQDLWDCGEVFSVLFIQCVWFVVNSTCKKL